MKEQTRDLLKRAGALGIVFCCGGNTFMNVYLYLHPPTHANALQGELWKVGFAILIALVFGWYTLRPRKRPKGIPIVQIEKGTRLADAEGRVFITTEDADIGGIDVR